MGLGIRFFFICLLPSISLLEYCSSNLISLGFFSVYLCLQVLCHSQRVSCRSSWHFEKACLAPAVCVQKQDSRLMTGPLQPRVQTVHCTKVPYDKDTGSKVNRFFKKKMTGKCICMWLEYFKKMFFGRVLSGILHAKSLLLLQEQLWVFLYELLLLLNCVSCWTMFGGKGKVGEIANGKG